MTQIVLLNNVDHHDLAVRLEAGRAAGEVTIFPTEVEELQREFPLLLRCDPDEGWRAVALLGLEADENLYASEGGAWRVRHLPALVQRGPFSIGVPREGEAGEPMIHIDLDDPRVRRGPAGGHAPLFLPHGGNAPYLDHIADVLRRIHVGHEAAKPVWAALDQAGLIEPIKLEVPLDDTLRYDLTGFHAIGQEALAGLNGEPLERLHRAGLLRLATLMASSLGNMGRLADAKQERRRS